MNSNATYHNVTKEELEAVVLRLGFVEVSINNTNELVYSKVITFEGAPTVIRLYTAIDKHTGASRPVGKDAIRVCLGRPTGNGNHVAIFKNVGNVRRTKRWVHNFLDKMDEINQLSTLTHDPDHNPTEADLLAGRSTPLPLKKREDLKCPECGAAMVGPKPSRKGLFFGCSRFPVCRGSTDARS